MAPEFTDDVDPSHRDPINVARREPLNVDAAVELRFPDRPGYDNKSRLFDDRSLSPEDGYSQGADIWPPISNECRTVPIDFALTVAMQRAILEHQFAEPVFRMWLSPEEEWDRVKPVPDWTASKLSDGRIAIWRKRSELDVIMTKNTRLWASICERIIEDDIV